MRGGRELAGGLAFLAWAAVAGGADLHVVQAGPEGQIARLGEAAEVRIVFSDPMVALGQIPSRRWRRSSPSPRHRGGLALVRHAHPDLHARGPEKLPYATRYRVTVDAAATSAAGRRLGTPIPSSSRRRPCGCCGSMAARGRTPRRSPAPHLRFNQPVRRRALLPHLSFAYEPHEWTAPELPVEARARDPRATPEFEAKVQRTRAAASDGTRWRWCRRRSGTSRPFPDRRPRGVRTASVPPHRCMDQGHRRSQGAGGAGTSHPG